MVLHPIAGTAASASDNVNLENRLITVVPFVVVVSLGYFDSGQAGWRRVLAFMTPLKKQSVVLSHVVHESVSVRQEFIALVIAIDREP